MDGTFAHFQHLGTKLSRDRSSEVVKVDASNAGKFIKAALRKAFPRVV